MASRTCRMASWACSRGPTLERCWCGCRSTPSFKKACGTDWCKCQPDTGSGTGGATPLWHCGTTTLQSVGQRWTSIFFSGGRLLQTVGGPLRPLRPYSAVRLNRSKNSSARPRRSQSSQIWGLEASHRSRQTPNPQVSSS